MDPAMQRAGNPKAMAKSKRNSSQRQQQRASFSHTKRHPLLHSQRQARPENDAGGGPDDKTLPSNWDSNEVLPLSDTDAEELARVAEEPEQHIDVKPKSRGADYNYLLTQDLIPLHHNVPELQGMSALLAASGLDSLAWNVFGTEQVHKGRQPTIDTAALLSVNLRALGESLAALSLSQRLFVEEEILTAQPEVRNKEKFVIDNKKPSFKVKPDVVSDSTSLPEAPSRPAPAVSWNASLAGIETSALESLSSLSIKDTLSDYPESTSGTKKEVFVDSSTLSAAESLFALSNDNTFPMKYEREEPENLSGVSHNETVKVKFDAQTAETELDALLDMLDAPPPPINSGKGLQWWIHEG
ncbi:unnamed protein product [Sphagnum jensenii]|uniref:Uncharacterized protein n=2 Tax=Sphagnum jensenii TaxID=128206 RepID=A0ABP1A426_9BRYO